MLTHLMFGTNDIDASGAFFDAALGPLGYARAFEGGAASATAAGRAIRR
ncbi:MAG: hypothetical protein WDM92_14445 [Caulobacteraceae bacterium]